MNYAHLALGLEDTFLSKEIIYVETRVDFYFELIVYQQERGLDIDIQEDVVCLECLLPGEENLVQIIIFDGTKCIVKDGRFG